MEIRRSYDHLISTMGFPILQRWHLYIESGPWIPHREYYGCWWPDEVRSQGISSHVIIPPAQRSCWGVYWFHSVRPSVHPSVRPSRIHPASRVCSVGPTVLVGSISYLYILSSNFRRCVACKVSCKISKFVSQNAGVLVVLVNPVFAEHLGLGTFKFHWPI